VVFKVGQFFVQKDLDLIKILASEILFQHPMYNSWMDEKVIDWCKKQNPCIAVKTAWYHIVRHSTWLSGNGKFI
jgi:hypothetical protein